METRELIDLAAKKVGGISALARELQWDKGSIAGVKNGTRSISPYRAAQIAKLLERDEDAAAWQALAAQSKGEEQNYWLSKIKNSGGKVAVMLLTIFTLSASNLPRAEAAISSIPTYSATNIHYAHNKMAFSAQGCHKSSIVSDAAFVLTNVYRKKMMTAGNFSDWHAFGS